MVVLFLLGSFGCQKEDDETEVFQVEVIGRGMDCGNVFLIRFNEEDESKLNKYLERSNSLFPIFYADNLIEEHKKKGLFLNVTLDRNGTPEVYACTMFGPTYGHVYIKTSETISLTFP